MSRRIPLFATLVVLLAVGVMIRLGFWQLDRLHQKHDLLAHYAAAQTMTAQVVFDPADGPHQRDQLYRRSGLECLRAHDWLALAGRNASGESGFSHEALCDVTAGGADKGRRAYVIIGWSRSPASPDWQGGKVQGIIAARGKADVRLVADPPLAGLAANALPDPRDIPNNHLSYAVQWFIFAVTALVIYGLALRKRLKNS